MESNAHHTDPHQQRTRSWRIFLEGQNILIERVKLVIDYMIQQKVDLAILLWAISWNVVELIQDPRIRFMRTSLMVSDELPVILSRWHKPPRSHGAGVRTKAAVQVMNNWAMETVMNSVDDEMLALKPILELPPSEFTEEALLAIKWDTMIGEVATLAPITWRMFRHAAYTKKQEARNTMKNPDACVLMMIAMASYCRSHRSCKLQKLNAIYFKSCRLGAKPFDTLHALGITMSQKWAYTGIDILSQTAHDSLIDDIAMYPWFSSHDNLNLGFKVYEQRLSNKSHFDSGTAATIIIIKDPACKPPNSHDARQKLAIGAKTPISYADIIELEMDASPRLAAWSIYQIIKFLTDAPEFDFETYEYNDHSIFSPPKPTHQLPTGREHATCQYMLNTVHIEEASYKGNDHVLAEWLRQLKLDSPAEQKRTGEDRIVVWVGDQLTVSRIRGLKKFRCEDLNLFERLEHLKETFGWFHAQIALEHSLHSQYYGTRAGHGLVHAFDLLERKGLHSPSVQGNFHYDLQDALVHVSTARFRDLWCVVGKVDSIEWQSRLNRMAKSTQSNGKVDSIESLRSRTPAELLDLATEIYNTYAFTSGLQPQSNVDKTDDVFHQAIQWNRDILDYLALDDAIGMGDIGRIQDLLPRLLFRFVGGTNSKYALEILELMQGLYKEWPDDLRTFITQYCWLTNTTGREGSFLPIDLLQEHNVRDIKYIFMVMGPFATWELICKTSASYHQSLLMYNLQYIFMVMGPFATWELICKTSASIPCRRRVKDHVEVQVNHFLRGKSHTSPDAEEDIRNLQAAYHRDAIHVFKPGRKLNAKDKVKEFIAVGSEGTRLKDTIKRWSSNRVAECATTQDWHDYSNPV